MATAHLSNSSPCSNSTKLPLWLMCVLSPIRATIMIFQSMIQCLTSSSTTFAMSLWVMHWPEQLFDGLLTFANQSAYVSEHTACPGVSTGFWLPDVSLLQGGRP